MRENAPPENLIFGRNVVKEALKSGQELEKVIFLEGQTDASLREIRALAIKKGFVVQAADRSRLDQLCQGGVHQGVAALTSAAKYFDLDELLLIPAEKGEDPLLIVLDGIEDPHNLGAIIRTAECAGAHGVIIPKRRAAGLSPAASKAAAGALSYLPVCRVTNIAQTLDALKGKGIWVFGAQMGGRNYAQEKLTGPVALVVGSEGEGISHLVREKCDFIVSIPVRGRIGSLNASVAAGVVIYEIIRQRGER